MPQGRPVGSKNMVTQDLRDTVRMLVTKNFKEIDAWIHQIKDPKDKVHCIIALMDFAIPRLARTELSGVDGEALSIKVVNYQKDEQI